MHVYVYMQDVEPGEYVIVPSLETAGVQVLPCVLAILTFPGFLAFLCVTLLDVSIEEFWIMRLHR